MQIGVPKGLSVWEKVVPFNVERIFYPNFKYYLSCSIRSTERLASVEKLMMFVTRGTCGPLYGWETRGCEVMGGAYGGGEAETWERTTEEEHRGSGNCNGMSKIETARWILAAVCFFPAAFLIVINWMIFWHNRKSRRDNTDKFVSWIPLLGGLFGGLAFWLVPVAVVQRFWCFPFILDYGCVIGLTETALYWLKYPGGSNE